jgi:hypothetical protein
VIVVAGDQMLPPASGDVAPVPGHGVDLATLPSPVAELLTALDAVVGGLAGVGARAVELDGRAAAAVARVVAFETSRLAVAQARMLPVVEADGLWSLEARSMKAWVIGELGVSARAAHAQVHLGRELRDHLPLTARAAAAGQVTVEHAQVLARLATNTEQRVAALADPDSETNEAWLVQMAAALPVDRFRTVVGHWASGADPDADDRGYRDACAREHLTVDKVGDGYHLQGFLSVEHGQVLTTALRAVIGVPAAGDQRSAAQRRAQGLGDLARLVIERGLAGTTRSTRPRIGVLVSYRALQDLVERAQAAQDGHALPGTAPRLTREAVAGVPQFEDGTPVPRALLDKLACDGELNRYLFGPHSEVLDVGRAQRTFTNARRDAIIARDRHCQYPGCHAPPDISECHHVKHWSRDHGPTSVANGIMLCWHHHDVVHQRHIEIHRRGDRWVFTDAAGVEIAHPRSNGIAS